MRKNEMVKYVRWSLLAIFLVWITYAAYLHQVLGGGKAPSIHAPCPFGGLESLYQVFTTGNFISKIFTGTMTLFIITLILTVLFRRSFCGLICPFGAIQEFFAKFRKKIFKRTLIMPRIVDNPLRYVKYAVLIVTVLYAWKTAGLWMAPYDPWSAYGHLSEGLESVWKESAVGMMILLITVLGSLLYDRFFCKYLCPMGAFYGILGKLSAFKVVRNEQACVHCGKCSKSCPMNIDVQHSLKVTSAECINCQTCVLTCPKPAALDSKAGNYIVKPMVQIALVMVVFFGSIAVSQAGGFYSLTPSQGMTTEALDYNEVKGYMSIEEAAQLTNTDLQEFYQKFNIPENVPSGTKMKEISHLIQDFDFDAVKESFSKQ